MAEATVETVKMSNEQRKAEKLRKTVQRASTWRQRVWAEQELRIRGANAELVTMGFEPAVAIVKPPTTDDEIAIASTLVNN